MRILLDENMPLDFGSLLPDHEVIHLEALGLKGTKNGELLAFARADFDALVTLDKGLLTQHRHIGNLIILVIRVINSKPETIRGRSEAVLEALSTASAGDILELLYNP